MLYQTLTRGYAYTHVYVRCESVRKIIERVFEWHAQETLPHFEAAYARQGHGRGPRPCEGVLRAAQHVLAGVYIDIYICILHMCIHVYLCVHMNINIYRYIHIYIYIYMNINSGSKCTGPWAGINQACLREPWQRHPNTQTLPSWLRLRKKLGLEDCH